MNTQRFLLGINQTAGVSLYAGRLPIRRWRAWPRDRPVALSAFINSGSNHAGLRLGTKRNSINHRATGRGAPAMLMNHTIRNIRFVAGSCAPIQALIAR